MKQQEYSFPYQESRMLYAFFVESTSYDGKTGVLDIFVLK